MRKRIVSALACLALLAGAALGQDQGDELRRAATEGDVARVKALLDAGADVNAKNAYGGTPLSFACDHGRTEVVRLLLERGADPNTKDTFYGASPLMWALIKKHPDVVGLLLDKGAQGVDEALMTAVVQGEAEIVKAVLEKGKPKPETLSNALAAATEGKAEEIAALLKAAGAQPPAPAAFAVDAAVLATYAGDYEGADGVLLAVTLKDGQLSTTISDGRPLALEALDQVTFRAKQFPSLKLIFETAEGKVTGLVVDGGTNRITLTRKEAAQ
jgi:hypothetical protein